MTALGLVVAVPAVLAYNWLQRRNKSIAEDLSAFSNDVLGFLASNGAVRPRSPAAAPSTAPAKPAAPTTTAGQTGGVPDPPVTTRTAGPPSAAAPLRWPPARSGRRLMNG